MSPIVILETDYETLDEAISIRDTHAAELAAQDMGARHPLMREKIS